MLQGNGAVVFKKRLEHFTCFIFSMKQLYIHFKTKLLALKKC